MKNFVLLLLMASALAYLALCAYCISATGSTDGLVGIGGAAITAVCGVVIAYMRRDDKGQDDSGD
ncbi:hypothetical protein JNN96_09485 [Mycobacterium sp. DSM 3803]|nr:hypothetical protein [Mycobacterium sp. DSM 3803]